KIARAIASSPLVKTAISGCDPNWGRMVSAAGYAGVSFDPNRVGLKLNGFELYREGAPVEFKAREVSTSIRDNSEARIEIDLGGGDASTRFWTSDLTADYVRFNSDYHT
ncbi:MAG: bifunctional ornithine acetyltransferase/N-acetylglutamate synthase, partial [Pirellulales bacterium]